MFLAWKEIDVKVVSADVRGDLVPLIEVPFTVKALVWCPEVGGLIRGQLVNKGGDFIAVRVLGLFNAVLVSSNLNALDLDKLPARSTIQFRIEKYEYLW